MRLKELAAEVGASPSIISRVLNGYNKKFSISNDLREKILQKAKEHNYRPNPVFSSIKQKNNKQIFTLFYSPSPKSVGVTMDEMVDEASLCFFQHGYMMNFMFNSAPREQLCYQLPPWKVAGLLIPDCISLQSVDLIEKSDIPYVCMNGIAAKGGTSVLCDEEDGMRQILTYLYAAGHRSICLCSPDIQLFGFYSISKIRREAFRQICEEKGISAHFEECATAHNQYFQDNSNLISVFDKKVTALICESSFLPEICHRVYSLGKMIPRDLSVVAYNDEKFLQWYLPPITTFKIPGRAMGKLAADILLQKITEAPEEYDHEEKYLLKGELIIRQSVADIN